MLQCLYGLSFVYYFPAAEGIGPSHYARLWSALISQKSAIADDVLELFFTVDQRGYAKPSKFKVGSCFNQWIVSSDAEVIIEGWFYLFLEDVAFHLLFGGGLKHWQDIFSEEVVRSAFTILLNYPLLRIFSDFFSQFLEKRFWDLVEMMDFNKRALYKLSFFFTEKLSHDFRFWELALNDLHIDYFMRDIRNAGSFAVSQHHLQWDSIIDVFEICLKLLKIEAMSKKQKWNLFFFI